MENKEDLETLLNIERMVILQGLAEAYLLKNGKGTFNEAYPNVEDNYGNLNDEQIKILRTILKEEYEARNLSLSDKIKESGEDPNSEEITKYEIRDLARFADMTIATMSSIITRKERLLKINQ